MFTTDMDPDLFGQTLELDPASATQSTASQRRSSTADAPPPEFGAGVSTICGASERYHLGELLGSGAGGDVFALHDRHLDRGVALKIMHRAHADDASRVRRFVAEARIAANLDHPGILPVYDCDADPDGRPWFTMRRADGDSLLDLIERNAEGGPASRIAGMDERIDILVRICDAVAFAHSRGIIHQDIKPANILIGAYGEIMLTDWGTAAFKDEAQMGRAKLMGTPMYMSPEQARRSHADERSDIYCIGATAFHLCIGRPPLQRLPAERFWQVKRSGVIAEPDEHERATVPTPLLRIILRCLAPDPDERFQDVGALREELRAVQRHQDSLEMAHRSSRRLHRILDGEGPMDYAGLQSCRDGFAQALAIWPANPEARSDQRRALGALVRCACRRGDADYAEETLAALDRPDQELGRLVQAARAERHRQRRRQIQLRILVACLLLGLLGAVVYGIWDHRRYQRSWHTVTAIDFSRTGAAEHIRLQPSHGGQVRSDIEITDGALRLDDHYLIWLEGVELSGSGRLVVEATWRDVVDGLELLFQVAQPPDQFAGSRAPPGYSAQFGGWGGMTDYIAVNRRSQIPSNADSVASIIKPDTRHRLVFERQGPWLRLAVDGQTVHRRFAPLPIGHPGSHHIALRAWSPKPILIHSITVERLGLPNRGSPLLAADTLIMHGKLRDGVQTYLDLAADQPGTALARTALLRALEGSCLLPDPPQPPEMIHTTLQGYQLDAAEQGQCHGMLALRDWTAGKWASALDGAAAALDVDPDNRIVLRLLEARRADVPPPMAARLLELAGRSRGLTTLNLDGLQIDDLAPLRGLQLRRLQCAGTGIGDLAPLHGMPLEQLDISRTAVEDLSPLYGMPLRRFSCHACPIGDLQPLERSPLEYLSISGSQVQDLGPLRRLPLRRLYAKDTLIDDLAPLAGMPLIWLELSGAPVDDLSPLGSTAIQRLMCRVAGGTDLAVLETLDLMTLHLELDGPVDLTALADESMNHLTLSGPGLQSDAGLSALRLKQLSIRNHQIRHLGQLRKDDRLQSLSIADGPLESVAGLDLPGLRSLNLSGNRLTELGRLQTPQLRFLNLADNQLSAAPAIQHLDLHHLSLQGNPLLDLSRLHAAWPTRTCDLSRTAAAPQAFFDLARAWAENGAPAGLRRHALILGALKAGDHSLLQRLATPTDARLILDTGIHVTWEAALQQAALAHAHLAQAATPQEAARLQEVMGTTTSFWLGLHGHKGAWHWSDGRALDYHRFHGGSPPKLAGRHLAYWEDNVDAWQAEACTAENDTRRRLVLEFTAASHPLLQAVGLDPAAR